MRTSASRPARCWRNSFRKGDFIRCAPAVAGGYGTPLDRKLDAVENDVRRATSRSRPRINSMAPSSMPTAARTKARSDALRRDMKRRGLPKDRPFAPRGFFALRLPALRLPDARSARRADMRAVAAAGLGNFRCC